MVRTFFFAIHLRVSYVVYFFFHYLSDVVSIDVVFELETSKHWFRIETFIFEKNIIRRAKRFGRIENLTSQVNTLIVRRWSMKNATR